MGSSRANVSHRGWGPLTHALWRARGLRGAGLGVRYVCIGGVFKVSRTVDLLLFATLTCCAGQQEPFSPAVLARRAPVGLGLMAHISGYPVATLACPVSLPQRPRLSSLTSGIAGVLLFSWLFSYFVQLFLTKDSLETQKPESKPL